eukprot:6672748-Pyramimonas_sp.AAC.5
MPDEYFKRVPRAMQQKHLRALTGISQTGSPFYLVCHLNIRPFSSVELTRVRHDLLTFVGSHLPGVPPDLTLVEDDNVTVFYPDADKPGVLAELLQRFSNSGFGRSLAKRALTGVEVYTSKDGSLSMDILNFASKGLSPNDEVDEAELLAKVKGTEGTYVTMQMDADNPNRGVIRIAVANVITPLALQRTARVRRHMKFQTNPIHPHSHSSVPGCRTPLLTQTSKTPYLGIHGVSIVNALVSSTVDTSNTLGSGNTAASVVFMKMEEVRANEDV